MIGAFHENLVAVAGNPNSEALFEHGQERLDSFGSRLEGAADGQAT